MTEFSRMPPFGRWSSDRNLRMEIYQTREPVPNSDSAPRRTKIDTGETSDGKRKVALFRKPATWEDGRLASQRPSSPSRASPRLLKGKARERGGAACRRSQRPAATPEWTWAWTDVWHQGSCFRVESGLICRRVESSTPQDQWSANLKGNKSGLLQIRDLGQEAKNAEAWSSLTLKTSWCAVTKEATDERKSPGTVSFPRSRRTGPKNPEAEWPPGPGWWRQS